jgi:hypothetical protein
MTVTLKLPPHVEQAYIAEARAKGVALQDLVREVLLARQTAPSGTDLAPEQWVEEFRAWFHSHDGDDLPLLSEEAISPEFIYRERGL